MSCQDFSGQILHGPGAFSGTRSCLVDCASNTARSCSQDARYGCSSCPACLSGPNRVIVYQQSPSVVSPGSYSSVYKPQVCGTVVGQPCPGVTLITQADIALGPYVITTPGRYQLAENLVYSLPVTDLNSLPLGVIIIMSSYVTLDLNGFSISVDAAFMNAWPGGSDYGLVFVTTNPLFQLTPTVLQSFRSALLADPYKLADDQYLQQVEIKNGTLGLSPWAGVKYDTNKLTKVTAVQNVTFSGFYEAAIEANAGVSQATFSGLTITTPAIFTKSAERPMLQAMLLYAQAFQPGLVAGIQALIAADSNPGLLPTSNYFGINTVFSTGVLVDTNTITLEAQPTEFVGIVMNNQVVKDAAGFVIDWRSVIGTPIIVGGVVVGGSNPLVLDAAVQAQFDSNPAIPPGLVDFAITHTSPTVTATPRSVTLRGDPLIGVVGVRFQGVEGGKVSNNTITVQNTGVAGSTLMAQRYTGADATAISITSSINVLVADNSVPLVASSAGFATGIRAYNNVNVTVRNQVNDSIQAGTPVDVVNPPQQAFGLDSSNTFSLDMENLVTLAIQSEVTPSPLLVRDAALTGLIVLPQN